MMAKKTQRVGLIRRKINWLFEVHEQMIPVFLVKVWLKSLGLSLSLMIQLLMQFINKFQNSCYS